MLCKIRLRLLSILFTTTAIFFSLLNLKMTIKSVAQNKLFSLKKNLKTQVLLQEDGMITLLFLFLQQNIFRQAQTVENITGKKAIPNR